MTNDKNKPLIYVPEKRNKFIHKLELIFSFIFTIVLWGGAIKYIYEMLFTAIYINRTINMVLMLLIAFVIVLVIEFGWQFYNWFKFHGPDRRKTFPRQSLKEVGCLYGISEENMEVLQIIQRAAIIRYADNKYYYCIEGYNPIEIKSLREI